MKTKEENKNTKQETLISDDELKHVAAGSDIDSLRISGNAVPLPEARSKKEEDGGYSGIITVEPS